jgi:photosystem II stability/assembly factor-like uncharacterized protein
MSIDPELERRLAERLRAELGREVGPRPVWAGAPVELRPGPRRWSMASALIAAVVVVAVATIGGVLLVGGTPPPSTTPGAPTGQPSPRVSVAPPTVPAGPFDLLLDGRLMRGDGWRLLAATYRAQGEPTPSDGAAGSIWAVSDPAILPKVWLAIGRDDLPAIDWTREVLVAVETQAGSGLVCGQALVQDVAFDDADHRITIRYEADSALVVFPPLNGGVPTGATFDCRLGARSAILVFALDRAYVPAGPITIAAFQSSDPLVPVAEARALLVTPPNPSGRAAAPILDAAFVSADVGWVRTATQLLLTDDAGTTWRAASLPIPMDEVRVAGVSFRDASHGWLIEAIPPKNIGPTGTPLRLWRTADGGRTWTSSQMPSASQPVETLGDARIVWIDAEHVVVDIEGSMPNGYADDIFATADGGRTWPTVTYGRDGVGGVPVFADARIGFLVGGAGGGRLYATDDGGRTWRQASLPVLVGNPPPSLYHARFFSPTDGLLFGSSDAATGPVPVVFATSDAGRTWVVAENASDPAYGCSILTIDAWTCLDPFHGTLDRWTDGGRTREGAAMTGLPPNADAHLVDAGHGWARDAQDDPGALYLTTDGGATWRRVIPSD